MKKLKSFIVLGILLFAKLPTEKLTLIFLLFAFTFPFALNATNYQEKYIWNKVYRPTNLAVNTKALIMTLPAVTGQTHYSIQYILNKAFFPDSSALRVLIDSAAMAGIKVDSAFYADSSFHLFVDSNYVVNKITGDTVVVGDNSLIDNGTYIQTSNFQGGVIFASSYLKTQKIYNDATYPIFINASANAYNDSLMIIAKCVDTVWTADSFNNAHFYNNMIVDDTLTIGNNKVYDNGTYISTPYFQSTTQILSENTYSKYYYNISGEPVVFYCKHGFDDSIVFVLMGNALAADTFLTADSLGNLLAYNDLTVKDTLTIGDNKVYDDGTYIKTLYITGQTCFFTNFDGINFRNYNGNPLLLFAGIGYNDSIIALLKGAGGDTVVDVDSFNNVRIWNNLTVDDTLYIGDNKVYDAGNYITFNSRISQKGLGYSTFLGDSAGLNDDLTDNKNTAIGYGALYATTSGSQNTSIGYQSMYSNTTGDENAVIGNTAMHSNKTGWGNTVIGYRALKNDTLGNYNVAIGRSALCFDITGSNNVAIGYSAGANATSGNNTASNSSVYIGYASKAYAVGDTNEIVIGANVVGAGSNTVTIGDTNIEKTILRGNVEVGTDDTLTYYNSNQILFKVIIQDSILTITQDAFTSFKFEKQELNTDTDYFLFAPANDSTKMVIKKAGYYKFKAKYAYDNNSGASVTDLLVAGRLTVNSKELLCSQILRQCEMKNATSRVLATSGFFNASVNDTIRFEYYSSDPNIDFHTNSVFDSLFAVGMSLEYMK